MFIFQLCACDVFKFWFNISCMLIYFHFYKHHLAWEFAFDRQQHNVHQHNFNPNFGLIEKNCKNSVVGKKTADNFNTTDLMFRFWCGAVARLGTLSQRGWEVSKGGAHAQVVGVLIQNSCTACWRALLQWVIVSSKPMLYRGDLGAFIKQSFNISSKRDRVTVGGWAEMKCRNCTPCCTSGCSRRSSARWRLPRWTLVATGREPCSSLWRPCWRRAAWSLKSPERYLLIAEVPIERLFCCKWKWKTAILHTVVEPISVAFCFFISPKPSLNSVFAIISVCGLHNIVELPGLSLYDSAAVCAVTLCSFFGTGSWLATNKKNSSRISS